VLIVDDNPMAREVLQGIGAAWAGRDLAASGEQALAVHQPPSRASRASTSS
jgi:CheY-like chemotaxis protein